MTALVTNDIRVAYTNFGDDATSSTPVVFVHGLAESKESWERVQKELADYRTYAYDLRGHGGTTSGQNNGTLEQLGQDLIEFLKEVTGPAIVVGFSLGGTIALWAAAECPALVKRPVVLGTSSVVGRQAVRFYEQRIEMAANTASEEFQKAVRDDTVAGLHLEHDNLVEIVQSRLDAIGDGQGYANAARAMIALHETPFTPGLAKIRTHVDVIGADHDSFCPKKASQIIVDGLNDATYHELSGAGHLMIIENPSGVVKLLRTTL